METVTISLDEYRGLIDKAVRVNVLSNILIEERFLSVEETLHILGKKKEADKIKEERGVSYYEENHLEEVGD